MDHFDAIGDLLRDAADGVPMSWWWLSFVDADTDTFLGVAIVPGAGMVDAVRRAHALGVNPGGEVAGFDIPDDHLVYADGYTERLLTREDVAAMDARFGEF